jgi:hypothetical protein
MLENAFHYMSMAMLSYSMLKTAGHFVYASLSQQQN